MAVAINQAMAEGGFKVLLRFIKLANGRFRERQIV